MNAGFLRIIFVCGLLIMAAANCEMRARADDRPSTGETIAEAQVKLVKITGAGGFQGLEPYQSGALISPQGHILTAWSYVLDTDSISVTLADGRKRFAALLGFDPRLEIAVLKVDLEDLPCFDLNAEKVALPGARVHVMSNIFNVAAGDESVSVQRGSISAISRLEGKRGAFPTNYRGEIYLMDQVTSNPVAAGGAVVNARGEFLAMIGKELRHARTNVWLNYGLPTKELAPAIARILAGEAPSAESDEKPVENPWTLATAGIGLVPDVVERTPPFVEWIEPGSFAEQAGLRPGDLLLYVNQDFTPDIATLRQQLQRLDRAAPVTVTVQREEEVIDLQIPPPEKQAPSSEKTP